MLLNNPIDPETQRRQALAKVYALLLRLADEIEAADSENLASDTSSAEQDPKPEGKESLHEQS